MELDGLLSTVICLRLLWPSPLTYLLNQIWSAHLWTKIGLLYIVDWKWVKFLSLVFDICGSQGFQDAQTYSQTDRPENRMSPAPKVFDGGSIKWSFTSNYKYTYITVQNTWPKSTSHTNIIILRSDCSKNESMRNAVSSVEIENQWLKTDGKDVYKGRASLGRLHNK